MTDLQSWQDTLAVEHAVIYSLGVVGATPGLAESAQAALNAHRARRAACINAVIELGGTPVASAPAYDVDTDVVQAPTDQPARQLAAGLEQSACAAYAALSSGSDRRSRLSAAQWLRESAVAQVLWIGEVPALPGLEPSP